MNIDKGLLKETWDKTLADLRVQVSDQTFNAWFTPIQPIAIDEVSLTLGVPNEFFQNWVSERYLPLIKSTCSALAGKNLNIVFSIIEQPELEVLKTPPSRESSQDSAREKKSLFRSFFPKHAASSSQTIGLNKKYTFSSFVVGPSNRFAHAACQAVSGAPAKEYNPLFIYGGVGLGKTHLMHSVGNFIAQGTPRAKILYISSEEFTNQLISAIQTRTMNKFRERYRHVDILLVDDIHFIAGKESTQEEFFHTFNALYDSHKQIIMSSDRSPKEISKLEERLVSRFAWGLVTDIQPPDFETRMAILKKKNEVEIIHVPNDVLVFLAENIKSNIRELEGALIRVVAYARLFGKDVSVNLAKEVLKGMIQEVGRKIHVGLIQQRVSEYFNISINDMKAKKRTQTIVYPRQIAMYLSRDLTSLSLPEVGAYFGGRDHTTVIHACNKIDKEFKTKDDVRKVIDSLIVSIKQ